MGRVKSGNRGNREAEERRRIQKKKIKIKKLKIKRQRLEGLPIWSNLKSERINLVTLCGGMIYDCKEDDAQLVVGDVDKKIA